MAKGRIINTHFWDDSYIIELDPIEKLLFLYLLTNPCTDIAGAYEISLRRMALDTGIERDMVEKILKRFAKAGKIIYKDGWILVVNWVKNQSSNPSVAAGVARSVSNCPDWIKDRLSPASPQSVLPNLTKPNLTLPNGNSSSLPKKIEEEINGWLDATAPLTGAKDRRTMATPRKWRDAVERAVREQRSLTEWLDAVQTEADRTRGTPQFFSAENCLKVLQAQKAKRKGGFTH